MPVLENECLHKCRVINFLSFCFLLPLRRKKLPITNVQMGYVNQPCSIFQICSNDFKYSWTSYNEPLSQWVIRIMSKTDYEINAPSMRDISHNE